MPWQNWSGVQGAQPRARPMSANEAELAALLARSSGKLRVVPAAQGVAVAVEDLLREAPALVARHRHFELFVLPFTSYATAVMHEVYEGDSLVLPSSAENEMLVDLRRLRDWLGDFPALRTWAAQRFIDPQQTEKAHERAHRLPVPSDRRHPAAQRSLLPYRVPLGAGRRHRAQFLPWPRQLLDCAAGPGGEAYDYIVQIGTRICQAHGGRPH